MRVFDSPPGRPEDVTRNLLLHPEETTAALTRIEGERWKIEQGSWTDNNVAGALAWLKDPDILSYVIFGANGHNRWIVQSNGEVCLQKSSSYDHSLVQATKEGFKII